MFSFESKIIDATVKKLLNGEDYRREIVNDINVKFLDFTLEFFRKIVDAKITGEKINLDWYKKYFLSKENGNIRDDSKDFDREVDFKLYDKNLKEYRCEVKLMGGGNPESADMVIARDTDIFIADTLSIQNKNQLNRLGISWLELRNHDNADIISQFKKILLRLEIPCS